MKIIMLSTQQESANGITFEQGHEYDLPLEEAQTYIGKGWAQQAEGSHVTGFEDVPLQVGSLHDGPAILVPAVQPFPVIEAPVPHELRSKADLSKPLSAREARDMNPKQLDEAGYPTRPFEDSPVTFPPKSIIVRGSRKPFGIFGAQTVVVKHHESVVDILKFLNQPTDGSVELLRPDTQVPFALEDYPYAYIFHNETLQLKNHNLRPAVAV